MNGVEASLLRLLCRQGNPAGPTKDSDFLNVVMNSRATAVAEATRRYFVNMHVTAPSAPRLPADKVTQGDIPLGLMQTSLRSHLSRMPHGRHIKEERKEMRIGNFSLDGRSHQTGDAAFTPAAPHDLHHSRANNDSHNSHNTQQTRVKQITLCFAQKVTQPSQTCS
jgi:hypothetical protein